jgi:hypothetical protein
MESPPKPRDPDITASSGLKVESLGSGAGAWNLDFGMEAPKRGMRKHINCQQAQGHRKDGEIMD